MPRYLTDGVNEKLSGFFAVGKDKDMDQLLCKIVLYLRRSSGYFLSSVEKRPRLNPGNAGIYGQKWKLDELLEDNEEADVLVLILEDPGLSHEHENPTDDKECGKDEFVLEHTFKVEEIHINFYIPLCIL